MSPCSGNSSRHSPRSLTAGARGTDSAVSGPVALTPGSIAVPCPRHASRSPDVALKAARAMTVSTSAFGARFWPAARINGYIAGHRLPLRVPTSSRQAGVPSGRRALNRGSSNTLVTAPGWSASSSASRMIVGGAGIAVTAARMSAGPTRHRVKADRAAGRWPKPARSGCAAARAAPPVT